jgi:hypothetical protein
VREPWVNTSFLSAVAAGAVAKDAVTSSLLKEMKRQGFRKHHVEVEAENENDAVKALKR